MQRTSTLAFAPQGHSRSRVTTLMATSCVLLLLLLISLPAGATTYVMPTDDELVDRAELVVLARVLSVSSAPSADRPSTDYLLEIDRVAKGFVPSSTLVVRQRGGVREDGLAMKVFGQPRLLEGDQVVLFLRPGDAGTFEPVDYGLGVFFETRVNGTPLAVRALGHEGEVVSSGSNDPRAADRARAALPRRRDGFLDWISAREAGLNASADYFLEEPAASFVGADSSFTLTRSVTCPVNNGNPARWFEFDQNTNVRWVADGNGVPGVPGNGLNVLNQAFNAWNGVSNTSISLRYNGTTNNLSPTITAQNIDDLDGRNLVLFEDPFDEEQGSFTGSGVLAVGTIFFFCDVEPYSEGVAHEIIEAGIVFQDGTAANFFAVSQDPTAALLEVLTHEVGHTIGLGHSCGDSSSPGCSGVLNDAIMRAFAYDDGRGARLNSDDRAGARALYGAGSTSTAPAAPLTLTATPTSTSEISLSWDDSDSETSFEIEERSIDGDFSLLTTTGTNVTSLLVTDLPEATFREYRVRARNSSGASQYSPVAAATTNATIGPCTQDAATLCLNQDRFELTTSFATTQGDSGNGQAVEITDDTGYFWFFESTNVEAVIKVLNGCGVNQNYWVFAGGLTNVEVVLTVIDRQSGVAQTYFNPQSTAFQPIQDTSAFATCP